MSQTILVEDNQTFEKLFSINLKTFTNTEVIHRKDSQDVIELLSILPSFDLIITRAKVGEDYTAINIINYLKQNEIEIDLIIIGDCPEYKEDYLTLRADVKWEELIETASSLLGVNYEEVKKTIKADYIPVDIDYFYEITESPCDVHIRIKKNGTYDYVKRLYSSDTFDKNDIDNYKSNNISKFYIHKDNQQIFTTYVTNKIIQSLENESLPLESRLESNSVAFNIIKEKVNLVGLDEGTAELATASIKSMIKSIDQAPILSDLLKMLLSNKTSYAYQKAHFLCLIGDFILSKQSWYTKKHLEIFAFCAFFSDITLKTREQMSILEMSELENSNLSQEEKEEVLNHAKKAAEVSSEHPDYTSYINIILNQHHGSMNGIGFFEDHEEELHPISKVFIISDYFVTTILDVNKPKNKAVIIEMLKERFVEESYLKVIKVLGQKID